MPPFLPACPLILFGQIRPLFDFDFTTLGLGTMSASSFATSTGVAAGNQTGLTFSRSTAGRVQTSPTGVVTSAIDNPRIGCTTAAQSDRGLVIQPKGHNILGANSDRNWGAGSGWTAGTAEVTGSAPSSIVGDHASSGGEFSPYGMVTGISSVGGTWSAFVGGSGNGRFAWIDAVGSGSYVTIGSLARLEISRGPTSPAFIAVADGRISVSPLVGVDFSASADYAQLEQGNQFSSEPNVSGSGGTGGSWGDDRVDYPTGSHLIAPNGQVKFYAKMRMKFASSMSIYYDRPAISIDVQPTWMMFSWGSAGQNYAYIKDSDKKLYVRIAGGTVATSTNAISFGRYDILEIYIAVGNNVASVAKYRINFGSWVDLVLGTISDAPNPGSNPVAILRNINPGSPSAVAPAASTDDTGQPSVWLQRLTFYGDGHPAGT